MRVLVITLANHIDAYLSVTNPELEICAFVADDPDKAKAIAAKYNCDDVPFYPYYHLNECLDSFYFDKVINATRPPVATTVISDLVSCKVPNDKIITLINLDIPLYVDTIAKLLALYEQQRDRFKMFATGGSYTYHAIELDQFKMPVINFASGSQDLYYNYKIAQRVINIADGRLRYALIGLAPFIFRFDISLSIMVGYRMQQWFFALRDLHNFNTSVEDYSSMFKKEFLDGGFMNPAPLDLNDPHSKKQSTKLDVEGRLALRKQATGWADKIYPKTIEENKKVLDDYLTLCEANDIRPLLFFPPISEGYMEMCPKKNVDEFFVLLNRIMKKHPTAVFFDGWKLKGFTDDYFHNPDHLNISGAAKFSAIFNDFIMELEKDSNQHKV